MCVFFVLSARLTRLARFYSMASIYLLFSITFRSVSYPCSPSHSGLNGSTAIKHRFSFVSLSLALRFSWLSLLTRGPGDEWEATTNGQIIDILILVLFTTHNAVRHRGAVWCDGLASTFYPCILWYYLVTLIYCIYGNANDILRILNGGFLFTWPALPHSVPTQPNYICLT